MIRGEPSFAEPSSFAGPSEHKTEDKTAVTVSAGSAAGGRGYTTTSAVHGRSYNEPC